VRGGRKYHWLRKERRLADGSGVWRESYFGLGKVKTITKEVVFKNCKILLDFYSPLGLDIIRVRAKGEKICKIVGVKCVDFILI